MAAPYFDLIRELRDANNRRLRLVESAQQRGLDPTAGLFATTVPTLRKWLRCYQQHGPPRLPNTITPIITAHIKLRPRSSSKSWLCVRSCPTSALLA